METRIKHLDGMRGLAILLVIGFHAWARWPEYLGYVSFTKDFPLFAWGYLGVPLFFMISGFVIFMTLDKSKSFINFMFKRWLRLFPAMLIVTLLIFATASLFSERPLGVPHPANAIPGLTFISPEILQYLTGVAFKPLEGSFWSLYVEAAFYIFIGAVYFTLGRKYCLPSLLVPMFLVAGASAFKMIGHPAIADFISKFGFIHYSWFMIGCLVYERLHRRDAKFHYALVLVAVLINFSYYIKNNGYIVILPLLLMLALFIVSFYSRLVERLLSGKFLTLTGFISYTIYLLHENMLIATLRKLERHISSDYVMVFMPIAVVAALYLVAWLITKYIEPAVRDTLRNLILFRGKKKALPNG